MAELWTPDLFGPRRHVARERIVARPRSGERVKVTIDDSGTVTQIEHFDTLDAIVRPRTITVKARALEPGR